MLRIFQRVLILQRGTVLPSTPDAVPTLSTTMKEVESLTEKLGLLENANRKLTLLNKSLQQKNDELQKELSQKAKALLEERSKAEELQKFNLNLQQVVIDKFRVFEGIIYVCVCVCVCFISCIFDIFIHVSLNFDIQLLANIHHLFLFLHYDYTNYSSFF